MPALTPLEEYKKDEREKLNRILSVPELRPLDPKHINLKMNNKTKVLFETVAAYAGINLRSAAGSLRMPEEFYDHAKTICSCCEFMVDEYGLARPDIAFRCRIRNHALPEASGCAAGRKTPRHPLGILDPRMVAESLHGANGTDLEGIQNPRSAKRTLLSRLDQDRLHVPFQSLGR